MSASSSTSYIWHTGRFILFTCAVSWVSVAVFYWAGLDVQSPWFTLFGMAYMLIPATVAALTASGILIPLTRESGVNPNLMVLAIGSGSLMFSHVNDSGFWMFKEYFNISIKDTLRSWSVMEIIVSVVGICGVMVLNLIIE